MWSHDEDIILSGHNVTSIAGCSTRPRGCSWPLLQDVLRWSPCNRWSRFSLSMEGKSPALQQSWLVRGLLCNSASCSPASTTLSSSRVKFSEKLKSRLLHVQIFCLNCLTIRRLLIREVCWSDRTPPWRCSARCQSPAYWTPALWTNTPVMKSCGTLSSRESSTLGVR